jgi:formylglycine-generating enzyme required for sulfatase activity
MELVHVAGGCFAMGAADDDCDATPEERPVHEACVDPFSIGKYEVTRGQWMSVMGGVAPPSPTCSGERCPISGVSWDEVQEFVRRLNAVSGSGRFRLPTEAEWEFAARSGGRAETLPGGRFPGRHAWHADNSGGVNHPVGTRAPNGLGLHDMAGNVWELTSDWYDPAFYASSPRDNPSGPAAGEDHVVRGGGRSSRLPDHRATRRAAVGERTKGAGRGDDVGFRLVFTEARPSTPPAARP